jgi:hypothetical protein
MSFTGDSWKPNRKQEQFLSLPTSIREGAYAGGAGSGKTDILLVYGIINRWHENPNFKQVFLRRTFPELRNEVVPRAKLLFRKFDADFNQSNMTFTFPSGATIILGHCQNEDDVHHYDSMEINLFTPDEITSFTEYQYLYIGFTRVRTNDKKLPAIIRCAGMPGGVGHSWFKKRFVDPDPLGNKIIVGRGGNKRIFVFATQGDNPHVDPNYKQSLEALPEAEKRAKLYGDFDAYLGQVFEEFRDRSYPDEPDNAVHVIEPFEIPDWWPKIVIGDWGYAAMTWIGYGAISPDKRLYIYREQWWRRTKIEEWAPYVREWIDAENPRIIKFCKSAKQDRGQEHTIQEQIETALGRPIELSANSPGSRVAGKSLLHEYLRWKTTYSPSQEPRVYSEDYSQWLIRNRPLDEYKSYINSFNPPEEETNIPKLQIFDTCPILISAIKAATYAKAREGVPAEDIAEFDGDDPLDGIRYMVDTADSYFDEASDEFEKIQAREELLKKLSNTQDFTAFYRNAHRIEATGKIQSVRRFHRARH